MEGEIISVRRLMIFIDGGYLRKNVRDCFNNDLLDYTSMTRILATRLAPEFFLFEIIRVYYYDALEESSSILGQELYLKSIKKLKQFEDRLGTLKVSRDKKNKSQKGVDTLIAIDMLSKAYQDQYDIAILISGDRDFSPVIDYVKNTGKRVYGIHFARTISFELEEKLDELLEISKEWFLNERIKKDLSISTNSKFDTVKGIHKLEVKLDFLIQVEISIFLHLVELSESGKIIDVTSKKIDIGHKKNKALSILSTKGHSENDITFESFVIRPRQDVVIILLVSDERRKALVKDTSFLFDFEYDYDYKDIKFESIPVKNK